jgi:hypothetical protein
MHRRYAACRETAQALCCLWHACVQSSMGFPNASTQEVRTSGDAVDRDGVVEARQRNGTDS